MNPASSAVFLDRLDAIRPRLFLPETEETWDTIARSLTALATACNDADSYTPLDLVAVMRSFSRPLISAMNSERSRLSGVAIDLVAVVASSLGVAFDPLLAHFFPVLLVLSSRTSKVTVARARACILAIIETTHLPAILSYLMQSVTDKSVSLRLTIVESTLACMNCFNPPDLEKDARAKDIEAIIRTTARDANADVRKVSKKVFEAYKLLLPARLESFSTPLTPTTRKYLDIQKVADKIKPSLSHPHPHPKSAQFSSSTSTVRGSSSRRPQTHARSASSPAVTPDVGTSEAAGPQPRGRVPLDMPPAKLPDASRQPVASQSTVVDRKRVVSLFAAVRPVGLSTTLGALERGRGAPVPTHPVRRPQPVDEPRQPSQTTSVVARRVPVSEVQLKLDDKASRAHLRVDNSASTPAIRHAPTALAESSKPPPPRAPNKDPAAGSRLIAKQKSREPNKQRSLMQPTLSQLSRAKTIERRVAVPTASKPRQGKPTLPRKAQVPASKGQQLAPPVIVTPASDDRGPTVTPASPQPASASPEPHNESEVKEETIAASINSEDAVVASSGQEPESEGDQSEGALVTVTGIPAGPCTPPQVESKVQMAVDKTPISELLLSIERGFLFTPSAPLSPPQSYIPLESASLPIPFPLRTVWASTEHHSERSGEMASKDVVRQLDSRRALGDVAINK